MVAGADGAELDARFLPVVLHARGAPGVGVVEQVVLDAFLIPPTEAEGDRPRHLLDDRPDLVGDRRVGCVEPHGHVAAADIEAHPRDADLLLVGDDAADRLGVAEVAVGADHAGDDVADGHRVAHLRQRAFVVIAEHLERRVLEFGRLGRQGGRGRSGLGSHLLLARCVSIGAPRRHRTLTGTLDPAVRVDAGSNAKLARANLIGI